MYRLRLFGGASIEVDGAPLTGPLAQRRRLAVLALLASGRVPGISRERLGTLLSPDVDAASAHKSLSDALHAIRKLLGKNAIYPTGDELRLDTRIVWSDVAEFEAAINAGQRARAVEIYRGPFLDGFCVPESEEFDRWAESVRSRLAGMHAKALETLAKEAESKADLEQAVRWWNRLVDHDPYSASHLLYLARALVASGDLAAALRKVQAHITLLRKELGVAAHPELVALMHRLQTASLPPCVHSRSCPWSGNVCSHASTTRRSSSLGAHCVWIQTSVGDT